jgi:D-glycero-D-manno-heptose 1,7-bisphosphate phosphatase
VRRIETVFLDRDGTINVKAPENDYVASPDTLVLLPGAAEAIRLLNRQEVSVFIVTNQRGVARGMMTLGDLGRVHSRLTALLAAADAVIDGIYFCAHEVSRCLCRKPLPGLIWQACRDHPEIRMDTSAVVGDADSDIELGRGVGCLTVRLGDIGLGHPRADHTAPSLLSAVHWLLQDRYGGPGEVVGVCD